MQLTRTLCLLAVAAMCISSADGASRYKKRKSGNSAIKAIKRQPLTDDHMDSFRHLILGHVPDMRADVEQYKVQLPESDFRNLRSVSDADIADRMCEWLRDAEAELHADDKSFNERLINNKLEERFYTLFPERNTLSSTDAAGLFMVRDWLRRVRPSAKIENYFLSSDYDEL